MKLYRDRRLTFDNWDVVMTALVDLGDGMPVGATEWCENCGERYTNSNQGLWFETLETAALFLLQFA